MQVEVEGLGMEMKGISNIRSISDLTSKFSDLKCEGLLQCSNYLFLDYVRKGENHPPFQFSDSSSWKRTRLEESDLGQSWRAAQQRISQVLTPVDSKVHLNEENHCRSQRPARSKRAGRTTVVARSRDNSASNSPTNSASSTDSVTCADSAAKQRAPASIGSNQRFEQQSPSGDADRGRYGDLDLLLAVLSGSPPLPSAAASAAAAAAPVPLPLDIEDNLSLMLKYTHVVGGGRS